MGVAAGRVAWREFAGSQGVVPFTGIPLVTLIAGVAALIVTGNLLASASGAIPAGTRPARFLRAK